MTINRSIAPRPLPQPQPPLDVDAVAGAYAGVSPLPAQTVQDLRPLQVVLVGEGTYPFQPGGVSLWSHQLIQGMPEHTFTVVTLTVHGRERSMWALPDNLSQVVNVPLWTPRPRRRWRTTKPSPAFADAHEAFLQTFLHLPLEDDRSVAEVSQQFLVSLRTMAEQAGDLSQALLSNESVGRLQRAWRSTGLQSPDPATAGPLPLGEAIVACDRLEHFLRPLSRPPLRADVCHLSMNGISTLVALRSKWAYGTPVVLSEHGVYLRERYLSLGADDAPARVKLLLTRFHRTLASATYQIADILAPHSSFNSRWQLRCGADADRIRTMYNGIDPADFPMAQAEPDEPTIVFVGRIDPLKDLRTLIRAFALVREELPTARLRMFGPVSAGCDDYYHGCLRLIEDLGLTGTAVFEGKVPRTAEAYQAGHLVALTSVSEGFPFTVVESMSVGRPPVCTDVGGVSEAVGDAGLVVRPRDVAAVAQACLALLKDGELRRSLGERARQRVLDRFTLAQWTDAYRDVYRYLTNPPGSAAADTPDELTP